MNEKVFHTAMLIIVSTLVFAGGTSVIAWRLVLASSLPPLWNRVVLGIVMRPVTFPTLI